MTRPARYASTAEVLDYLGLGEDALRALVTDSEAARIEVPRVVVRPKLHRWYLDRVDAWFVGVCSWRGSNSARAAGSSDGGSEAAEQGAPRSSPRKPRPSSSSPSSKSPSPRKERGNLLSLVAALTSAK